MAASKRRMYLTGAVALLLLWLTLGQESPKRSAYAIRTPEGKRYVPEDIVARKDCKAFEKFAESLTRPGFVADPDCPWAEITPIGTFQMGDITMRLPREYIWYARNEPDGPTDGLNLAFKYPEMTPGDTNAKDRSNVIAVAVRYRSPSDKSLFCQGLDKCPNSVIRRYLIITGRSGEYVSSTRHKPDYDKVLGLHHYSVKNYDEDGVVTEIHDAYYSGNIDAPDYWLWCSRKTYESFKIPMCETSFYIHGNLVAEHQFRRTFLPQHQKLRKLLLQILQSFIIPTQAAKE